MKHKPKNISYLNEKDLAENVKKFPAIPVLSDKSNDEFHRKDIRKNAWTKLLNPLQVRN